MLASTSIPVRYSPTEVRRYVVATNVSTLGAWMFGKIVSIELNSPSVRVRRRLDLRGGIIWDCLYDPNGKHYPSYAGEAVLRAFLNWDPTCVGDFLNIYGKFTGIGPLSQRHFEEWQALLRKFLKADLPINKHAFVKGLDEGKVESFDLTPIPLSMRFWSEESRRKKAAWVIQVAAGTVLAALIAQAKSDKVSGSSWDACASPRCGETFKKEDPRQKFCSDNCSHYERVTRHNEKKRTERARKKAPMGSRRDRPKKLAHGGVSRSE